MRGRQTTIKTLALLTVAGFGLTACATPQTMSEEADAQALETAPAAQAQFRVLNDTQRRYMTISLRTDDGNVIPLGNVSSGDTETFVLPVDARLGQYQLVAEAPGNVGSPDMVVSRRFLTESGMTVNWYLDANELEVS